MPLSFCRIVRTFWHNQSFSLFLSSVLQYSHFRHASFNCDKTPETSQFIHTTPIAYEKLAYERLIQAFHATMFSCASARLLTNWLLTKCSRCCSSRLFLFCLENPCRFVLCTLKFAHIRLLFLMIFTTLASAFCFHFLDAFDLFSFKLFFYCL